jgi:hypothetical protein
MSKACGAFLLGDFHHLCYDEWSGKACADGVFAFVERIRLNRGKNVVFSEFRSGINRKVLQNSEFLGFLLNFLQVLLLPDVDCYGYDLGFMFFLEPFDEYGCVQSA